MTKNNSIESPDQLLDIAFGYQRANVLFALVKLKIPTLLNEKPLALNKIAEKTSVHPLALDRLLSAAVALRLIEKTSDQTFRNAAVSNQFLIEETANYLGEQFEFYLENSYPSWTELTEKLQSWQPGVGDEQSSNEEDQSADTLPPQHNLAVLVGKALGRAYDFSQHKRMLDVGGGTGAMSLGICSVHQNLQATVWDLPKIIEKLQKFVKTSDVSDRVKTSGGNFKTDEVPSGFDCILLANLLSVASEETNREFFKQIYDKLPSGGAIVISGWIVDDNGTTPEIAVLFSLEDIINQVPDVERTNATYQEWLKAAGFINVKREIYLQPYSYIVAVK